MRIGQTSIIVFVSEVVAALLGFVATVYFARILGAEVLGIYFLIIAVVSWLKMAGDFGLSTAVTKRLSEGGDESEIITAGVISMMVLFGVICLAVTVVRDPLAEYLEYSGIEFVVLLVFVGLLLSFVHAILEGQHLVHVSAILSPTQTASRSLLQIGAVFAGFNLVGMLWGYAAGTLLVALIGMYIINTSPKRPERTHFKSILSYAKYSWLGSMRGRVFNWVDVVVLGFFVPSGLIGIYSVSWNIAMFLAIFAKSVGDTLFPEMSKASETSMEVVSDLTNDSLTFAGLMIIPGLVGGFVLSDRILLIYGEEFVQGFKVLMILIGATLVHSYQKQLLNILNAINRPDLSFRVNFVFIILNIVMNIVLIYQYGWIGAAVATLVSMSVALALAFWFLRKVVQFNIPVAEIGLQCVAAAVMGLSVYGARAVNEKYGLLEQNILIVLVLVFTGAGVYFLILSAISTKFRRTVLKNIPQTPLSP